MKHLCRRSPLHVPQIVLKFFRTYKSYQMAHWSSKSSAVHMLGQCFRAWCFAEELGSWSSMQADALRLSRAKNLLMEVWTWVSSGCSGSLALQSLFCWLILAVSIVPLAEQANRLKPVHSTVKSGLQRVGLAAPQNRASTGAKAWTSALFLLDGTAEAWWWLRGIRSFEQAPRPWTDSEDGGVGVAQSTQPEDVWQQGEDPFDGNDLTAAALEFDRELDKVHWIEG
eukprot:g22691.t1